MQDRCCCWTMAHTDRAVRISMPVPMLTPMAVTATAATAATPSKPAGPGQSRAAEMLAGQAPPGRAGRVAGRLAGQAPPGPAMRWPPAEHTDRRTDRHTASASGPRGLAMRWLSEDRTDQRTDRHTASASGPGLPALVGPRWVPCGVPGPVGQRPPETPRPETPWRRTRRKRRPERRSASWGISFTDGERTRARRQAPHE